MPSSLKAKLDLMSKGKPVLNENRSAAEEICTTYTARVPLEHIRRDYSRAVFGDLLMQNAHKVFRHSPVFNYEIKDMVFFDTETTGLSHGAGTLAFLIGLGYFHEGDFFVEQFLMKDYCQEKDMLEKLADKLSGFQIAISFNGKSFDAPIIGTRSVINRMMQPVDRLIHWDLLHPSRRLYKARLQSCSLKSIESNILGFEREGDIPGAEIPEIFFSYVKYNDQKLMDVVVKHNRLDIISLLALTAHLCSLYNNPEMIENPSDMFSMARIYEQDGHCDMARQCYLNCCSEVREASLRLAFLYKRSLEIQNAIDFFNMYSSSNGFSPMPDIEISKLYEHQILDYRSALLYAEKARQKVLNQGVLIRNRHELESVNNRINRIKSKMHGKAGLTNGG